MVYFSVSLDELTVLDLPSTKSPFCGKQRYQ